MTGRERLTAVLSKQPKDRLPWCTLVDDVTLALVPGSLRGNGGIDFYKHLGCDIFLLNGWNTPHRLKSPRQHWPEWVESSSKREGNRVVREWNTPKGKLTAINEKGHPVKYRVDSPDALRIYREMWENAVFAQHDDSEPFAALESLVGDHGVITRFWGPSTIPRLLEEDIGVENFYYMMADRPDELVGLIETMHERELDAFRILTEGPWSSITLVENTTRSISAPISTNDSTCRTSAISSRLRKRAQKRRSYTCAAMCAASWT